MPDVAAAAPNPTASTSIRMAAAFISGSPVNGRHLFINDGLLFGLSDLSCLRKFFPGVIAEPFISFCLLLKLLVCSFVVSSVNFSSYLFAVFSINFLSQSFIVSSIKLSSHSFIALNKSLSVIITLLYQMRFKFAAYS